MKNIEIRSRPGTFIIVDDEDFENLNSHSWCLTKSGHVICRHNRYGVSFIHHEIFGRKPGFDIDHINRNKLDNRKSNLRFVRRSFNIQNTIRPDNSSGIKGVKYDPINKKWEARIRKDGKRYFLGRFKNGIEAAKAYNSMALNLYGPHALLNEV